MLGGHGAVSKRSLLGDAGQALIPHISLGCHQGPGSSEGWGSPESTKPSSHPPPPPARTGHGHRPTSQALLTSGPWEAGGWAAAAAAAGALGLPGWLASATPRRGDWDLGGAAAAASVWKRCVPGWEEAKTGYGRLGAPSWRTGMGM